ncbi:MAG: dihydroorotate dehydrogenase electron transfer subunit [Candidatus Methanomethylicota archaeon]|uniref:Dihydroorotate dehydrogenase electron transfer subunit n=2 Tax=Thermoproteota archaeon TaxID=2056631 RepID=A0A497EWN6_9CREN|nr:MAG: dihydroorotate dehydrogenase electron transfer subunit [Candidatus Verstraetearchaeota archaeon]
MNYQNFSYKPAKVVKRVKENVKAVSLYLKVDGIENVNPGQFFMVWLPGFEEVPISASGYEGDIVRITVAAVGLTTRELCSVNEGQYIMLKGPIGRGFSLDKGSNYVLLNGGYGAAPLIFAAKKLRERGANVVYVHGAKTADELLFLVEASQLSLTTYYATEDGSYGFKGLVTQVFEDILNSKRIDAVLACGPELMMYKAMQACIQRGIYFEASLERYMKCGMGICGTCVLDPLGLRVCVDGPVFDADVLSKSFFGKKSRKPSGEIVDIS